MDFAPIFIVAIFIFLGWKLLARRLSAGATRSADQKRKSRSQSLKPTKDFHWEGKGDFDFEVVGESNYQKVLGTLAGQHGADSVEKKYHATLVLDNSNHHDSKAVAVQIESATVGYLSRVDARSYRRRLGQKGLSGIDATCDALIVGGGIKRNGEKLFYGVKLDIKPFE